MNGMKSMIIVIIANAIAMRENITTKRRAPNATPSQRSTLPRMCLFSFALSATLVSL